MNPPHDDPPLFAEVFPDWPTLSVAHDDGRRPRSPTSTSTADLGLSATLQQDRAARGEVWVSEHTTPYVTDSNGENPTPTIAAVSSHLFVFERAGDGWRLAEDLTAWEFQDGG
ncbi:hypothetical protein OIE69_35285 [Actinacidiphila glaucinigra]|uniref:hypothetical protein n=1 Tax=Actinacidiphila glaucinigra TaxID=235986 RepID=UPI002DDB5FED|nr:hypothetical protein [Actinacidiphila glaucinigra]WSD63782.1 hypothetical protein OIE69_35285 [Actinacidiphila glaucinigra]